MKTELGFVAKGTDVDVYIRGSMTAVTLTAEFIYDLLECWEYAQGDIDEAKRRIIARLTKTS